MIKGDLHFHSLHSACQGHNIGAPVDYRSACGERADKEIIDIAKKFQSKGYEYLGITNHVNDPLSEQGGTAREIEILHKHISKVSAINDLSGCPLRILVGVEVNILNEKGELSLNGNVLKEMDIVVASNHRITKNLSRGDIKNGLLNAIRNPHVNIIGHLTRFIKELDILDWQDIIRAAEENNKIIEYNLRAPMKSEVLEILVESSALISIGSDTHPEVIDEEHFSLDDYVDEYYKLGVRAVEKLIKLGIGEERIVNTFGFEKLMGII